MLNFTEYLFENMPDCDTCAIETVAAIVGKSKQEVWKDIGHKFWKKGRGVVHADILIPILKDHYKVKSKTRFDLFFLPKEPGKKKTQISWKELKQNLDQTSTYLISVKGHVLAWVKGEVTDTLGISDRTKIISVEEIIN